MTGTELFNEADRQLSENFVEGMDTEQRWPSNIKIVYLNDSLQPMWIQFPEAFWEDEVVVDPPAEILEAKLGEELPVSREYTSKLLHFIIGRCLGEDSEDANNQALANQHYAMSGLES